MSHPFGFIFGPTPSPEQQEQMQADELRRQMELDNFRHGYQRLFLELDRDQLQTLRDMLHALARTNNDPLAASWEGMAAMSLRLRFGVCTSCEVNHDEELQTPTKPPSTRPEPELVTTDTEAFFVRQEADTPLPIFGSITDEDRQRMAEFHLDDVYEEGSGVLLYFACTGIKGTSSPCGMTYPSIEDRMKRPAEDCSGCFERMAHG